jgi:hypothetical protein
LWLVARDAINPSRLGVGGRLEMARGKEKIEIQKSEFDQKPERRG